MSTQRAGRRAGTFALLTALGLSACAFTPPEETTVAAQPRTAPVRNITSFSSSLRCMDDLFRQYGKTNYLLTSQGIPDATGEVSTGTKEMLIGAISKMSVRSNAFSFIDYEASGDIAVLASFISDPAGPPVPAGFEIPNYYVRGAVTQLDSGVIAESVSGGVGIPQADIGASTDQTSSVVTVDLNVGNLLTRRMLPGVSSSNSIVVRRTGSAVDAGATIQKLGANFNMTFNRSEGMHQAVRTLIELGTIEVLGKLLQVPYWRCLEIEQTNPEVTDLARDWFEAMEEKERVRFVQRALKSQGLYAGEASGALDAATREAVGNYQAQHDLLANGKIDFPLYAALIAGDLALGREPDPEAVPVAFEPRATEAAPAPIRLSLTTPRGTSGRYSPGESFGLNLRSNRDAFVYCYYQDAGGTVVRLFPNRFNPDPLVQAHQSVEVPGTAPFDLVAETPNSIERVMCIGAPGEIGTLLPAVLKREDLTPIPVADLGQIERVFKATSDAAFDRADVQIQVLGG